MERSSFELAAHRGRSEFILRISRLADIENHSVVPGLHKIYTLGVVYHLNPLDLFAWYDVPMDEFFSDAVCFPAPRSHLMAPPVTLRIPVRFDPAFDPQRTELLSRMVQQWGKLEGALTASAENYRYGYVGLGDRRMMPLLQPGSVVLVDSSARSVDDMDWANEYERPMYFVEIRGGYRCGWFYQAGSHLVMQPHPLSRCLPESWSTPEDAEVVGRVVGVVTRLTESSRTLLQESQVARGD